MSRAANHQPQPRLMRSPAKVNLFLEVLSRRTDGFHELETIMVRTDLYDTLWIEDRSHGPIELTLAELPETADRPATNKSSAAVDFPLDESNLITRAARALQKHTGVTRGASIRVRKMIPARAGLGGGSSNAATTLLTLNELWELNLPLSTLHEIAATLGSDVNFLLSGCRAASCRGRGEQISPISVNGRYHGVLVVPPTGNSTLQIFNALQLPDNHQSSATLTKQLQSGQALAMRNHCFNRLQSVARQLNPDVHDALSWLDEHAGGGLLTGSGSACFSVLKTAEEARRLANQYSGLNNGLATAFRF